MPSRDTGFSKSLPELHGLSLLSSRLNDVGGSFRRLSKGGKERNLNDFFRYTARSLQMSITKMSPTATENALNMFDLMTEYISLKNGRSEKEHRAEIVSEIVSKANSGLNFKNELSLQLVKQTRGHSDLVRERNAWKLFSFVAQDTLQMSDVGRFVENYVMSVAFRREEDPLVRVFAYAVLEGLRGNGHRAASMQLRESDHWHLSGDLFTCHVFFTDGSFREVVYDASTLVSDALEQTAWSAGLRQHQHFALFADNGHLCELLDEDRLLEELIDSEAVTKDGSSTRLLLKQVMFRPADAEMRDPDYMYGLFVQLRRDYMNADYAVNDLDVVHLCVLQMIAHYGNAIFAAEGIIHKTVLEFIPHRYLNIRSQEEWVSATVEFHSRMKALAKGDARIRFIEHAEKLLVLNGMLFPAEKAGQVPESLLPYEEYFVSVSHAGVHFYWPDRNSCLLSVKLTSIASCEFDGEKIVLKMGRLMKRHQIHLSAPGAKVITRIVNTYKSDTKKPAKKERKKTSIVSGGPQGEPVVAVVPTPVEGEPAEKKDSDEGVSSKPENVTQQAGEKRSIESWMDPESSTAGGDQSNQFAGVSSSGSQCANVDPPNPPSNDQFSSVRTRPSLLKQLEPPVDLSDMPRNETDVSDEYVSLLENVNNLSTGLEFSEKYVVKAERVRGKPHIRFARSKFSGDQVVLKFYTCRRSFENSSKLHAHLSESKHVCKLLDVIDSENGFPPCLVFQKGNDTLDEWLLKKDPNHFERKSVLLQILEALIDLHSHDVVHCDIKPSNIMIFGDYSWKLLDLDSAAVPGMLTSIRTTYTYAAPEMFYNALEMKTEIAVTTSADMWSFGIVAFEVLAGKRFYEENVTPESVKGSLGWEEICSRLRWVPERQSRGLAKNLLSLNPRNRPTASMASASAVFKAADNSSMYAARWGQMNTGINKLLDMAHLTLNEVRRVNLMISVSLEDFADTRDPSVPFDKSEGKEVFQMLDEYLPNDPVFVLNTGKSFRVRVCLMHEQHREVPIDGICYVRVALPDGSAVNLDTVQEDPVVGKCESVSLLDPSQLKRLPRLSEVSPTSGELDQRYVPLDLTFVVEMLGDGVHFQELKHRIYCKMVSPKSKLRFQRFVRQFQKGWEKAPQWMRDGARASVFLAKIGAVPL